MKQMQDDFNNEKEELRLEKEKLASLTQKLELLISQLPSLSSTLAVTTQVPGASSLQQSTSSGLRDVLSLKEQEIGARVHLFCHHIPKTIVAEGVVVGTHGQLGVPPGFVKVYVRKVHIPNEKLQRPSKDVTTIEEVVNKCIYGEFVNMGRVEADLDQLKKASKLSDDEEEGTLVLSGIWEANVDFLALSLVGRVLSNRTVQFEALCSSLQSMLLLVKGMEVNQLQEGRFLLRFKHIIDKQQALEGCPSSFEKNIVILKSIRKLVNPMQVVLDEGNFFVHIHDLPLHMMNLGVATLIGNRIGCSKIWNQMTWGARGERRYRFGFEDGFQVLAPDLPNGPWLRAPVPMRGRNFVAQERSPVQSGGPRHSQRPSITRAAIFGSFKGKGAGTARVDPADSDLHSQTGDKDCRGRGGEEVESM
ncbi:UNVERIFIED_CONTAM: hypothetical protein Sradi_3807600 [Sesamum radiatum]|uniref:DUF4283 domain-containing protein n=1 Tax=Sesamum radiatum TaxID=300843 RepID=A0AAW2Q0V2_SESRA